MKQARYIQNKARECRIPNTRKRPLWGNQGVSMGLLCGVFGACGDSGLFDYPIMAVSAYFETAIPALV